MTDLDPKHQRIYREMRYFRCGVTHAHQGWPCLKQHDASGLWAADCGCTWHSVSRAYLARVLEGHEARAFLEGKD